MTLNTENILSLKKVKTTFITEEHGEVTVLDGVSFDVKKGRTLGIVGESGCGKSITAASIMNLLPQPYGKVASGEIEFQGRNIANLSELERCTLRGKDISMIFQDPMTALNPVVKVGKQVEEVYELHNPTLKDQLSRRNAALDMFKKVGISEPEKRLDVYPHELSGGMRQRVMIAMALACEPKILIADEPTTALDVTIQAQILDVMKKMQQANGMSIIFITHDLGVVAEFCDDVAVMYAGNVVEQADIYSLFDHPTHPYTQGLLNSIPKLTTPNKSLLETISGSVPSLQEMPQGCRFTNRCQFATAQCSQKKPVLTPYSANHLVACLNITSLEACA